MANLNEDALKSNLDVDVNDVLHPVIPPVYAQAVEDHKDAVEEKDAAEKVAKDAVKKASKEEKVETNKGAKQMHLSEGLFEDMEEVNDNSAYDEEEVNDNIVYNLVHNELFGEHNYKPVLGLPGATYRYEDIVLNDDVSRKVRDKAGVKDDEEVIGVKFTDEDEDVRKNKQKRIRVLAKKLGLPFVSLNKAKVGFIHMDEDTANKDANEFVEKIGVKVERNPIIKTDKKGKLDEAVKVDKNTPNVDTLAKEIENAVKILEKGLAECYTIKLDDRLAVCVGWSGGYDEFDENVIHNDDDPSYAINTGIKVWTSDDMRTDYDWINAPYYKGGEVVDTGTSISKEEDYVTLAKYLLDSYNELKDKEIARDGLIIEEEEEIEESCKVEKKELKESLNEDGIDVKFDLIDRAKSYIDEGKDIDDAIANAIDDGLIYDQDRIAIAYYVGALDTSELLGNAYDSIFSEIYEEVKDYKAEKEEEEEMEYDDNAPAWLMGDDEE